MGVGESCQRMSTVVRANYATKQADVTDLDELEGLLSPFQVEKLTYFFNQFFDFNEDGKIDAADFAGLNERLRKVAGWGRRTRSTSTWSTTTECSSSVSWSRCWRRGTRRVSRRGAGPRLSPPARWSSTLSLSPRGFTCGPGCARAELVLMTSPSGFNLSPG